MEVIGHLHEWADLLPRKKPPQLFERRTGGPKSPWDILKKRKIP
jgi:hypothetical protein